MSSSDTETPGEGEDLGRVEKLEKLLRALQNVKRENVKLRDNFFSLQEIHRDLRGGYVELQEENNSLRTDLVSREAELSTTVEELAQELDQSYRQFEEAKAHILTQTEAKSLEERLRTEIEGPYLEKIDELDNIIHEKIEEYSELWKVQELLKEEHANSQRQLRSECEVHESRYEALLEEVEETKKITDLYSQDPNELKKASNEFEVRALSLEQQNKALLDKIKAEREGRLRAEVEAQEEMKSFNEARTKWREGEAEMRSKTDKLVRQCDHLQGELKKSKESEADLNKALLQAQKDLSAQKSDLEAFGVKRDSERALSEGRMVKMRSDFERERTALEASVGSQDKRIALLTTQHMKEIKDFQEDHATYVAKLEAANSKLKLSGIENAAKDRAEILETQKRAAKIQVELDLNVEKVVKLERANAQMKADNSDMKEEIEKKEAAARKMQADLARTKEEASSMVRDLEKHADKSLRSSSDLDRAEREKKKLQHDFEELEDRLRTTRRSYEDQIRASQAEAEDLRRTFALERSTSTRKHEEAQQSAIKTYLSANAKLKRKLGKSEENATRLEREYTLLLIKMAELEAERKELRMQLNFGLSDLSAGNLGLSSNIRTLASDIMRDPDESTNEDDVALALAAVGA